MLNIIACVWLCIQPAQTQIQPTLNLTDSRFNYSIVKSLNGKKSGKELAIKKGAKVIQQIPLPVIAGLDPQSTITSKDVNFDGQLDLIVTNNRGNVNSSSNFYLFDKGTGTFVFNPVLSRMLIGSEIKFDEAKKQIVVTSRSGCCEYEWKTYRYEQRGLKLVSSKKSK